MPLSPAPDGGYQNKNTAEGSLALDNIDLSRSQENTAVGDHALAGLVTGSGNTAIGSRALLDAEGCSGNTAVGVNAGEAITDGLGNTAIGFDALAKVISGQYNTAIGNFAGIEILGNFNICIGSNVIGIAEESNTIRIGLSGLYTDTYIAGIHGVEIADGLPVVVASDGHLGTGSASPQGSIIFIKQGFPAPAGYTNLGTYSFKYKDALDHSITIYVDVYQKD